VRVPFPGTILAPLYSRGRPELPMPVSNSPPHPPPQHLPTGSCTSTSSTAAGGRLLPPRYNPHPRGTVSLPPRIYTFTLSARLPVRAPGTHPD
jgi:hypothetical protein